MNAEISGCASESGKVSLFLMNSVFWDLKVLSTIAASFRHNDIKKIEMDSKFQIRLESKASIRFKSEGPPPAGFNT